MKQKSSAHYQREYRRRLREAGFVKKEVWILPENARALSEVEKILRKPGDRAATTGMFAMDNDIQRWSTATLHESLLGSPLVKAGSASIELVDGIDPALRIVMNDYGDLPIYLSVSGDQVLVESVLWSVNDVVDVNAFNAAVLRTHKYFPLSTISLDLISGAGEFYRMFGALSARSLIQNIIFEIEVLASNVIQATEAYSEFLVSGLVFDQAGEE